MADVDNIPPIDNRAYHFFCRYHGSAWPLEKGTNSVANGNGLNRLNTEINLIDSKLKTVQTNGATPAPDCYTAVWHCAGGGVTQSLASSAALANPTLTYTNDFALSGTPSIGSFNTSNGQFSLGTAGYWRITYNMYVTGASAVTEGYISVVLKDASLGAYPVRSIRTLPIETRAGETSVFKSVLYRVSNTGNFDLDHTKTYVLTTFQENNLASALTTGGANTWIAIEYVRPL